MESCIFGPVPSRRLGRSLGVDVVPYKTCSYDCIYCQLGRTTHKTTGRKEWVPIEESAAALQERLATQPDYITLPGSGEPTLNSRIGELIDRIKTITKLPVAVLANGSLLWQEEVRRQLADPDLVVPSLDAANETAFRRVNRPHDDVSFERLIDGLVAFRGEFRGDFWLEVFLLTGYTADDAHVASLAEIVRQIRPGRIQLNTVTRPPVERFAVAVSEPRMHELAGRFHPPAEVICKHRGTVRKLDTDVKQDHVLEFLSRRPGTVDEIAEGLGMHPAEVSKYLGELFEKRLLLQTWAGGLCYYQTIREGTRQDLRSQEHTPKRACHDS